MAKTLVDQFGPDTIRRFEQSAPRRLEERDSLSMKYPLTAVYLYGYAAEMMLKAAYFRNLKFGLLDEIDSDTRNRAMGRAQLKKFMGRDPHDIPGWARLLVWEKQTLHAPAYKPDLGRKIVDQALIIYENWRPQMRYRNTSVDPRIVARVRSAASWMIESYSRF